MKKKYQGFLICILVGIIVTSGSVFGQHISKTAELVYNNIKVFIDGEEISPKDANGIAVEPFTIEGTTYLPVRAIADAFGKEVIWDDETQSIYLSTPQSIEKIMMYAPDGRTLEVLASEVTTYLNVGWYIEPVTTMYAPDGRTLVIAMYEVDAYQRVGWYQTYQAAMDANQPTYVQTDNSYGVYRTPTGKRYHLDPDCGGKNSYPTTLQKAKNAGLTPCKKCVR